MNISKVIVLISLLALLVGSCSYALSDESNAVSTYSENGLVYTLSEKDNTASITSYDPTQFSADMKVPQYITVSDVKYHVTQVTKKLPNNVLNKVETVEFEANSGLQLVNNLFSNSKTLTTVTIGDGITLGNSLFSNCTKLTSVTLPSTLVSLPTSTFSKCTALKSVSLGSNLESIGDKAFTGCTSLESIVLPDSLKTIGSEAFSGCSKITSVNLGPNVISVGKSAFNGLHLDSLYIPAGLTNLDMGPGSLFEATDVISISENNPSYLTENGVIFNKDKTVLVYYPRTLSTVDRTFTVSIDIGGYAFYNTTFTKIVIETGAKSIGEYAFSNCAYLEEVIVSDSIESIGGFAFAHCPNLNKITLSKNLSSIGESAFVQDTALKNIQLPESLTSIGQYTFRQSGIESITIPSGITTLGSSIFWGSALTTVNLLGKLTSIGDLTFGNCSNLTTINLPDSLTSIGARAFMNTNVHISTLPSSLTVVGHEAFMNCPNVVISELPASLTSIEDYAFYNTGIESITVGESNQIELKKVSSGFDLFVFGGTALKSIELNNVAVSNEEYYGTIVYVTDSLTEYKLGKDFKLWSWEDNGIGVNSESKTAYLVQNTVTKFTIPSTVEKILGHGFQNSNITEIGFEGGSDRAISIVCDNNGGIFQNCIHLEKVNLPTLTLTGNTSKLFQGCTALKELEIESIAKLGNNLGITWTLSKFIIHHCKDFSTNNCIPSTYYIQFPTDLTSINKNYAYLCNSDGTVIKISNTTYGSTLAGKTFVWSGAFTVKGIPLLAEVSSDDVVVTLCYGDLSVYVAAKKDTALDLTKYNLSRYNVTKWYSDEEKKTEYVQSTLISEEIVLYAEYSPIVYTVVKGEGDFVLTCNNQPIQGRMQVTLGDSLYAYASVPGSKVAIYGNNKSLGTYGIRATWSSIAIDSLFDSNGICTITCTITPFTVTMIFNSNNGNEIPSISGTCGESYQKPNDPVRTGYQFIGWSPSLPDSLPNRTSETVTKYTYEAIWSPLNVSLVFDADGGNVISSLSRTYNSQYSSLPSPSKEGYTFAGWYYGKDYSVPVQYEDLVTLTESITLYAKWDINQYTVTYMVDGKQAGDVETYDYGTSVVLRDVVSEKTGYTVIWTTEDAIVSDGKFVLPAKDVILTEGYVINQYTISFDTDGGSAVASITQDYGTAVAVPVSPTKTGYDFVSWNIAVPTTMPAEDVTITAVWAPTVTVDSDGNASVRLVGDETFTPSADAKNVTISLGSNTSVLIEDVSSLVGKSVASSVEKVSNSTTYEGTAYEFSLTSDGIQYNGKMLVTLPYVKEDGKQPVVYFVDGEVYTKMDVKEAGDGFVTFETDHNSLYVVSSEDEDDDDNVWVYVAVAAVIVLILVLLALYYLRSKKSV